MAESTTPAVAKLRALRYLSPPQVLVVLCVLVVLVALMASASGALAIPRSRLLSLLWTTDLDAEATIWRNVLIEVRLPRIVLAVVVGAALALSGAVMQALFRNPLAEPGLVGISLGGAAGAVIAIVLGANGLWGIAPLAFVGSLIATALAYKLGTRRPGVANLLLAGVAINAICASVVGFFTYQASDVQLRNLTFWNMGSLAGATWSMLAWIVPLVAVLCALLLRDWRVMNALLLGEREAHHLGFDIRRVRRRLIVLTALLVGPLVAVTGTIGFVGLVVPHLVRLPLGADHRWLLPNTIAGGAMALTLADWLARIAVIPAELPIGIVTSLVGGPFLLWMLTRKS
ncbi:iron ABC transporter permease [Cupriavidus pauculus]|uniref:Iron ABC transporter permease n=1 Tax=Cupriavidus pauculus TaxID=82633 RepID=A0A5P2HDS2_9BURK|nr:iron ABC transporter permease [Cupriavidus pauculus]QET05653.1 iron ABC transporter permease [Cupriavidus pauculus]